MKYKNGIVIAAAGRGGRGGRRGRRGRALICALRPVPADRVRADFLFLDDPLREGGGWGMGDGGWGMGDGGWVLSNPRGLRCNRGAMAAQ